MASSSGKKKSKKGSAFEALGLSSSTSLAAIKNLGFSQPTPIQRRAIPLLLRQRDCILMSRTGSGKTACFLLPLLDLLGEHSSVVGIRAVLVAPTRELVAQIHRVSHKLLRNSSLRLCCLLGGENYAKQFLALSKNPDILLTTVGRGTQLIQDKILNLCTASYLVLDEADQIFELGWRDQLTLLFSALPANKQVVLVSATLPAALIDFAKLGLRDPEFVRLDKECTLSDDLRMDFLFVRAAQKIPTLLFLLKRTIQRREQVMVFASTRHQATFLQCFCERLGFPSAVIYGAMDQAERVQTLGAFKKGKISILLVTDVAARGLDIPFLPSVINFDFPSSAKLFVHRVGRTARAGRSGTAVSLVTAEDLPYAVELMSFLGGRLVPPCATAEAKSSDSDADASDERASLKREECASTGSSPSSLSPGTASSSAAASPSGSASAAASPSAAASAGGAYVLAGPPALVDPFVEFCENLLHSDEDVALAGKTAASANVMYYKTRPSASRQSVERAKHLLAQCGGAMLLSSFAHPAYASPFGTAAEAAGGGERALPQDAGAAAALASATKLQGEVLLSLQRYRPKVGERGSVLSANVMKGMHNKKTEMLRYRSLLSELRRSAGEEAEEAPESDSDLPEDETGEDEEEGGSSAAASGYEADESDRGGEEGRRGRRVRVRGRDAGAAGSDQEDFDENEMDARGGKTVPKKGGGGELSASAASPLRRKPAASSSTAIDSLLEARSAGIPRMSKARVSKRRLRRAAKEMGVSCASAEAKALSLAQLHARETADGGADGDDEEAEKIKKKGGFYLDLKKGECKEKIQETMLKLDEAAMDLVADENDDMKRQRSTEKQRWDPKKRKYIMMKIDSTTGRAVKRKRGTEKQEEKTSSAHRYAQWCRETKRRIQRVGEEEDPSLTSANGPRRVGAAALRDDSSDSDTEGGSSRGGAASASARLLAFTDKHKGIQEALQKGVKLTHKQQRIVKKLQAGVVTSSSHDGKAGAAGSVLPTVEQIAKKRRRDQQLRLRHDKKKAMEEARKGKEKWMKKQKTKAANKGARNRSIMIVKKGNKGKRSRPGRR
ncbi:DEAD/DEAH box helicase domain-containing protein [Besnoitia besnoiti]|uniref:DEAD/DEAH box helicase domain-containing protein n=1 Tax=Besnoitia besnoiti TaxID=94643 RepID=A0A2A9M3K9_BESBE|nr:DEAD/DEAH box helicase domain-containing protein [Besnoitia besnoiti]PFH31804.1 DEAD/DEAH box helicase domain-containing protein [Besnoitia besnoiti]